MATRKPKTAPAPSPERPTSRSNPFGEFIRERREALGLKQKDVAAAVDDARASITNIEVGGRAPYADPERLTRLATVLQVDAAPLIALAAENRAEYTFSGVGAGVTDAHRDLALVLERGWGTFSPAAIAKARELVLDAAEVAPAPVAPTPFGAWLVETRLRTDVTQTDIGHKVGLARSYLSMVETGEKGVSFPEDKVDAIAKMLDGDVRDVRELAARSRQFYKLDTHLGTQDEVSLAHRQLAAALLQRWAGLPADVLKRVATTLERSSKIDR